MEAIILSDLILKNRSFRRFDSTFQVEHDYLLELINNVRYVASARNLQPLMYKVISDKNDCQKVFPHLKWAGYLSEWQGPNENEKPTAYILIALDKNKSSNNWTYTDLGIAAQTIMLQLAEKNLGGCMIASFNKNIISNELKVDEKLEIVLILAIGKPAEEIVIVEQNNLEDVKYWRENNIHFVPKRCLEDILF